MLVLIRMMEYNMVLLGKRTRDTWGIPSLLINYKGEYNGYKETNERD